MSRCQRTARVVAPVLLVSGALVLGYVAYAAVQASRYQAHEHARLAASRHATTAPVETPVPADGDAIGELQIPRLGLSAIVAEGDSPATLQHAVGHLADTARPGQTGNVVLAGHRDTFFRPLRRVRAGDAILLRTSGGDFHYRVESTAVVPPTEIGVLEPSGGNTLTLITCYPFVYLGAAPDRFIVLARAVATAPTAAEAP